MGNQIFYKIGDYYVLFIPVYTAPGGGVVTELGTIATVGADFGEYYVGLGSTVQDSFGAFLLKIAGLEPPPSEPGPGVGERVDKLISMLEAEGVVVLRVTSINPDVSFHVNSIRYVSEEDWGEALSLLGLLVEVCHMYGSYRVFTWQHSKVNFGVIVRVEAARASLHRSGSILRGEEKWKIR